MQTIIYFEIAAPRFPPEARLAKGGARLAMTVNSFRGFETFEHTADIGIRAWGGHFTDVFEEAAKALFSVMVELDSVAPKKKLEVKLTARSGEELFLAWLKELLFISDTQHVFLSEFKMIDLSPTSLAAEVRGEAINNAKHAMGREVKAVTQHQFKLVSGPPRYLAEVILDI